MIAQFLGFFIFIITTFALIIFYYIKVFWHLKLLTLQNKKGKTSKELQPVNLLIFDWKNAEERKLRLEALWMYPLLFPVEIDEKDNGEILHVKQTIKRWNIAIYLTLIAMLLSYIYISKSGFGS
ncbi:MAG: hypothetical protein ACK4EX_01220 [Thermaurantimonas sp.]|uniref:hypothetical protein n=1 Tax=Thermaurantimonas sp. TaxID=2681568 RepID=UPI0039191A33